MNQSDGKQQKKKKYFNEYYFKNKQRIQLRNKLKYKEKRNSPEKSAIDTQKRTETTKRWRERNKEKVKQIRKQQYDKRKRKAYLQVSKTGKISCNYCGCDEINFLEINHLNGGGAKEHRESGKVATVDRILTGKRDTKDLNLLCRVCNALEYLKSKNSKQIERYKIIWTPTI